MDHGRPSPQRLAATKHDARVRKGILMKKVVGGEHRVGLGAQERRPCLDPRPGRQVPQAVRRDPRRHRHPSRAHRDSDSTNERCHETLDSKLPTRTSGSHIDPESGPPIARTTTNTDPTAASPTPDPCTHCPTRSPTPTNSLNYASVAAIASAASSKSTNTPLDLPGREFSAHTASDHRWRWLAASSAR